MKVKQNDEMTKEKLVNLASPEELADLVMWAESIFMNVVVESGVCCCGDNMEGHSHPMSCGHTPVDMADYAVMEWSKRLQELTTEGEDNDQIG